MTATVTPVKRKIIGIVQPTYLPWLPFFERMALSDVFLYLDDVKYSKNSFHNRNAIKGPQGRQLLTVPILYKGHSDAFISEIEIDNTSRWTLKHWKTIEQCYRKAPFFERYREPLQVLYQGTYRQLIDIALPLIEFMKKELGIQTPCYRSSEIPVEGSANVKLVNLCKHFEGTHFVVKPGTTDYHPVEEFQPHGLEFFPIHYSKSEYPQQYGPFEPYLSALDYLMNCGPGGLPTHG